MSEFYKIRFIDKGDSKRVWLGRTRVNYNPTFIECVDSSAVLVVSHDVLSSTVLLDFLKDRKYELIPVDAESMKYKRVIATEEDWEV